MPSTIPGNGPGPADAPGSPGPAEIYERFLVPAVFGPWAAEAVAEAAPLPGQAVLDVACGTGAAARLLAAAMGPRGLVVGLDLDPGMLAVARATPEPLGGARIQWRQGDATRLPFEEGSFDQVTCLEGIQFFPDRVAGLREMRRVLRPGGQLTATVWGPLDANPGYAALAEGLRAFVDEQAARLPPFSLTDASELGALVVAAGFEGSVAVTPRRLTLRVPSARDFASWIAAGAPTARHKLALLPAERREAFLDLVERRLARFTEPDGSLALPSVRNLVRARR